MKVATPDARLLTAAEFVRQGARFADIGTDHAYLPVFLIRSERVRFAVATDIAPGPLSHAEKTVREAGLSDRITLLLSDGLAGVDAFAVTDIAICGMGGELIASILGAAPFVRDPAVRLILQPMSRFAHLRRYLAEGGFEIEEEAVCHVGRHYYSCLCVHFSGIPHSLSPAEAEVGRWALDHAKDPAVIPYLRDRLDTVRRRVAGQQAGGESGGDDLILQTELERYL